MLSHSGSIAEVCVWAVVDRGVRIGVDAIGWTVVPMQLGSIRTGPSSRSLRADVISSLLLNQLRLGPSVGICQIDGGWVFRSTRYAEQRFHQGLYEVPDDANHIRRPLQSS